MEKINYDKLLEQLGLKKPEESIVCEGPHCKLLELDKMVRGK